MNVLLIPKVTKRPALLRNLEGLCKFACEMIGVDHSGFVLFTRTLDRGEVVAQFPTEGFEGLHGRNVQLEGIEAEERLLHVEGAFEILNLDDQDERRSLGSVAELLAEFKIKSLYVVMVRVRGQVIGSFSLDRVGMPKGFSEDEKKLCKSLADLASLIIENAFLSDWLEVFQESTKAMISQQDINTLLDTIVDHAVNLLEVEEAGIYERRYDSSGEYLELSAASRPENERVFRRDDGGMAWQLIDGSDPFQTTPDYSVFPYQARQFRGLNRFGSVLEVPMTWLHERIGVLFVAADKGREFEKFDADRLQRIADIATLAIQRLRLLTRIEKLSDASVDFSKGLDTESLNSRLTTIARYATEILGAEMCGVFRIRDPRKITLEASFGHKKRGFQAGRPFEIVDGVRTGLTGAIACRLRNAYLEAVADDQAENFRGVVNMRQAALTLDPAVKGESDNSPSGECYSLLAVPLFSIPPAKPQMTGLLRISNKRGVDGLSKPSIRFSQEDEWILRIFAEAATVAIESAELFSDREAVRRRLERTRDAMTLLGIRMAHGDPVDALRNALSGIMIATQCDSVVLYPIDSRSHEFLDRPYYVGLVKPENIAPPGESLRDTAVGKILELGDLHVAHDAPSDPIMTDVFQQLEGIRSSAGMPIWIKELRLIPDGASREQSLSPEEKVNVGVLFLNYKRPQTFTEDEQQIIRLFAPFVAVSVRNQELYEQEQKKAKVQRALLVAANSLAKSLDLGDTTLQITKAAYEIAKATGREVNFVGFGLISGESAAIRAAYPEKELYRIAQVRLKDDAGKPKGIVGVAVDRSRTQRVNNVADNDDYLEVHPDTKSELCVPILALGEPIGVINIESPNLNTFYKEDEDTFELFAALASDAIRNAQQYADLESAMAVAGATALAAAISHSHKETAQAIALSAESLKEAISPRTFLSTLRSFFMPSSVREAVDEVLSRATRLSDDLNEQRFDYESFSCISVNEFLSNWTNARRAEALDEGVGLLFNPQLEFDVMIRMQPELLTRVLDTLFHNAITAMQQGSERTIWIGANLAVSDRVEITMANNGPEMVETAWRDLGNKPFASSPPHAGKGVLIACTVMKSCAAEFRKFENSRARVVVGFSFPIQDRV